MTKRILITPITLFLFLCLVPSVWFVPSIQAQTESFYRGKTIRVIVGTTSGGQYDRWARLLSQHMPKYIPGNPDMIVQNMPGAGSLVAANYVYGVAKPDGLTLGMFTYYIYMDQLLGHKEVRFDLRRFNWIGSQEKSQMILLVRADSPYKSIEDILKAKEPPKCGATGTSDSSYVLAKLLEESLGAKFQMVTGYQGEMRWTWPWKGERLFAAEQDLAFILAESLLPRGTKRALSGYLFKPGANEIRDCSMLLQSMRSWTSIRLPR